MIKRNIARPSALAAVLALALCSPLAIARSFGQKAGQQTEASTTSKGLSGVDVGLKKKPPSGDPHVNERTDKDGRFTFESVPLGTYTLIFSPPPPPPALAGKVEYLVIIEQFDTAAVSSNTARHEVAMNTIRNMKGRIAVEKIKEGIEITVGPGAQEAAINSSRSNINNTPTRTEGQARMAAPQAMTIQGRIALVEIGKDSISIEEKGMERQTKKP